MKVCLCLSVLAISMDLLSCRSQKGEHFKLTEFITQNKTELDRTYSKLTIAQKQVYKGQILEVHEKKQWTAQANPKAVRHDINASLALMDRKVCSICFHLLY
jgi:hypothetical protein